MNLRHTSLVTFFTGVNLVASLLNQMVLAYLFGAGSSMDAFLACGAVPFVILNLAIGDLGYILVPLLMQCGNERDREAAVRSAFSAITALSVVATLCGLLLHREILRLTTASAMPRETFELAARLAPAVWLVIGLTILGSFLTGQHSYLRSFTVPSVTLVFPYVGMIIGGLAGARVVGIQAVVAGWVGGTLARDIALFVSLGSARPRLTLNLMHGATKRLFRSLVPLGASLLPFASLPMIDVFWASRLPVGSISYLGYSTRIVIAVTSIVVQGVSVVIFPDLSSDVKDGKLKEFREKASDALLFIFSLIVPLASLMFLLRMPFLEVFLQRGKFTLSSSQGVARVLPLYLAGAVWMSMMNIISRSYFALEDYITPAITGLVGLFGYVFLSGVFIRSLSYRGVGLAYLVFWLFLFFAQTTILGRRVGTLLTRRFLTTLVKTAAASGVALGGTTLAQYYVSGRFRVEAVVLISVSTFLSLLIGLAVYGFRLSQYRILVTRIVKPFTKGGTERNHA